MTISFYQPPALPADETARSRAVVDSAAAKAAGDPVLDALAHKLLGTLRVRISLVSVILGDTQHVLAAAGVPRGAYSRRQSFCGHAVAHDQDLFVVPDLSADTRFAGNPWVSGEIGELRFYAAALLRDAQGHALGTVCVADNSPRLGLTSNEEAALRAAAADSAARLAALRPAIPPAASAARPTSRAPQP